jgi:hypothetical protein
LESFLVGKIDSHSSDVVLFIECDNLRWLW